MKTLLVQDYLKSGKSLENLKSEYGVNSYVTNGKISLNYDMILASRFDPLSAQCRGLILREKTYEIVAYGLNRFYNLAEVQSDLNLDWNTAIYENKLDGTCIICYFDNILNKWCCATRSRSEADVNFDNIMTFSELVDYTISTQFYKNNFSNINNLMNFVFPIWSKDYTFVFELTTPLNRIVCKYNDYKLTLLAVRNNKTFLEEDPLQWSRPDLELMVPETFKFSDLQNLIEVINTWNPEQYEGVVIKDCNFNRVKVKNLQYVAFNKLRDSLSASPRNCLEIILLDKSDDLVGMLPDFILDRINSLKIALKKVFEITENDFNDIKNIDDMKSFAMQAELKLWPAALYALKRNKVSDLKDFAVGKKLIDGKISTPSIDKLLYLCEKMK